MSHYENHKLEANILPFIYKERTVRPTNLCFGTANWHENIEMIYVTKGEGAIFCNGQEIAVREGDVVVINANQLHTIAAGSEALCHRYLIVDRSFCLANGIDSHGLVFETVIHDTKIKDLLEALDPTYRQKDSQPFRTVEIRSLVLQIMVCLCRDHSLATEVKTDSPRIVNCIKQAIDYIRASYQKSCSLDDVAEFVGINKYYLSHEFHKFTGYSFVAYVNLTRCKAAELLLAENKSSIRRIASLCGFESCSYFAKCFEKYMGLSPSAYRLHLSSN